MAKSVLTYIITKEGGAIKRHFPARDRQTKEEMARFESCVRNIQNHGIYAPFARVLGLPGVAQIKHGPFPHLPAIALGVSAVHQSTPAGVNTDTRYQALKEAAHQVELE